MSCVNTEVSGICVGYQVGTGVLGSCGKYLAAGHGCALGLASHCDCLMGQAVRDPTASPAQKILSRNRGLPELGLTQ